MNTDFTKEQMQHLLGFELDVEYKHNNGNKPRGRKK